MHRANHDSTSIGRSTLTALAATIAALCAAPAAKAQFDITTGTGNTGQNFNGLTSTTGSNEPWANDTTLATGDSTLDGWSLFNFTPTARTTYRASTGSDTTGSFYSFGLNAGDRAFGGLGSGGAYFGSPLAGAVAGYIAFAATNNSGDNLASFTLGFDGEQWRNGGNASMASQTMVLNYGFGATFDAVTNWFVPGGNFNWTSTQNGATAGAVDGNGAGLVAGRGGTINGLNWANGETLWLRWVENNDLNNDHGLAIDNFTFSWAPGLPPKNLTWTPVANGNWDTTEVNWTDETPAPSAFSTGDSVNFTDIGLIQSTVTVAAGGVSAGTVTVGNTIGTYTLTGGAITSNARLEKTAGGTLVLGTTFSQGLNAQVGTVRLAAGGGFGDTGAVTLALDVTFDLNGNTESIGALTATGATITTGDAAFFAVNGTSTLSGTTITGGTSNISLNGAASLTDTSITSTGLIAITGNVTVPSSIAGSATTISGILSTGTAGRTYNVFGGNLGVDLDLDADMIGTGRVAFIGAGIIRLGGDNSAQTGGFRLNSGPTYLVENAKAFGNTQLFFNGGTLDAGIPLTGADKITTPISFGGSFMSFTGEDVDFAGTISFFDTSAKLLLIETGQTVTFSGTLDSSGTPTPNSSIIKTGEGTLVLAANASAYNGSLLVDSGMLVAETEGSLGSGDVTVLPFVSATATLEINARQKIAGLTIGDGGLVVLTEDPGAAAVNAVVAVPEPASAGLLACGVLGLLGRRRSLRGEGAAST